MLSLAPATRMSGEWASAVIVGSFCLFCENGVVGLPVETKVSSVNAMADAAAVINTAAIVTIATTTSRFIFVTPRLTSLVLRCPDMQLPDGDRRCGAGLRAMLCHLADLSDEVNRVAGR